MFTRSDSTRIKREFWTTFGRYMSPVPSAEGEKINWINYHTRMKGIYFRMDAAARSAVIAITVSHPDRAVYEMYVDQFLQLKAMLHAVQNEEWKWELQSDSGSNGRIYREITGFSVFNKDHWPDLISFFKPRIIGLDAFWTDARHSFDELR